MKRSNKTTSILLTLVLLAALLAPMAVPAAASSTYSANTVQNVAAGQWYNNDNQGQPQGTTFNRIIMEVVPGSLSAGQTARIRMSLPIDFKASASVAAPDLSAGGRNLIENQIPANLPTITAIGTPEASPTVGRNVYREFDINIIGSSSSDKGLLYIDLNTFKIPSGKTGDIKVSFDAPPGSPLSSGNVLIAQIGSGVVTLAMDDVSNITISSALISGATYQNTIASLLVKEDRAGALATGDSVKIKLPGGFSWDFGSARASYIWNQVAGSATLPTAATLTTQDSGRTLVIPNPTASTVATYYRLDGLRINVDESVAKKGNIECTLSGTSSISNSSLIVGKLGDYASTVTAFGDPKEVRAGRVDEEIGKFAIEESAAGSLANGRTITLQLTGGAVWRTFPTIDATNSSNANTLTWSLSGTNNDTIKATVTASASAAKYVLEKATVDVSCGAGPEIKVVVGGTAGAAGEVVVAKNTWPITIKVDKAASVITGAADQPIPDIIIAESKAEAIVDSNFNPAAPILTGLYIEFPTGIFPSLPNVEVIEGDLVIDKDSIARGVFADGRWVVGVSVKSTSSTPSKVKFSNLKLRVDRSVAEGPVIAAVMGASFPSLALFPRFPTYAAAAVANVVTPASGEVKTDASFVIDSNKYKAGGAEKTMDAAPYVKDGRTFLPVRYVAEALGVAADNIMWNEAGQTVTLLKSDKVVQIKIGDKSLLVNGIAVSMDAAAEVTGGRAMLPVRFIAQTLGANVVWDEATKTVTLK